MLQRTGFVGRGGEEVVAWPGCDVAFWRQVERVVEINFLAKLDRVFWLCIMRTSSLLMQRFFKKMNNR